jgi:hypothetical protein
VTLKRAHLIVAVRAAQCGVQVQYASLAVLPRLDLHSFERHGRAVQPSQLRASTLSNRFVCLSVARFSTKSMG